jgi:hypothetical protein
LLDDAEARTQRAMEAIAAYLARCPMAADTEEGIAQWWLPGMGVDVPQADVHEALERLLRSGALATTVLPGGGVIYRAAPLPLGP